MAQARFQIFNAAGQLVLDLADNVAGDVRFIETGQSSGSYTVPTAAGEFVEFAYQVVQSIARQGSPSQTPNISVSGNTISWYFDASGASNNKNVSIIAFVY